MGNPDGATPAHIVAKLIDVAQRPDTHGYSTSRGIPRLRRAISHWYEQRYGAAIDPDSEAVVTIGSKEGLAHLMLATLGRGDTVLVPRSELPDTHVRRRHCRCRHPCRADRPGQPIFFAELEQAIRGSYPKPKLIVLGFPSNPTAMCVELDFFRAGHRARTPSMTSWWCMIWRMPTSCSMAGRHPRSCRSRGPRMSRSSSLPFRRATNMAGWRIGFMAGNRELVSALARIKSYHDYGIFTPAAGGGHCGSRRRSAVRKGDRRAVPGPARCCW